MTRYEKPRSSKDPNPHQWGRGGTEHNNYWNYEFEKRRLKNEEDAQRDAAWRKKRWDELDKTGPSNRSAGSSSGLGKVVLVAVLCFIFYGTCIWH